MAFGGVQGMITTLKNNRIQKSDRKTLYDRENFLNKGTYGDMDDHKTMKSHVFAAFQKEQFQKKRKERARNKRIILISLAIVIGLIIAFLLFWNTNDFDLLKSPEFK